jgi:hypothetical protein
VSEIVADLHPQPQGLLTRNMCPCASNEASLEADSKSVKKYASCFHCNQTTTVGCETPLSRKNSGSLSPFLSIELAEAADSKRNFKPRA